METTVLQKLTEFVGYIPTVASAWFEVATQTMQWVLSEPLAIMGAIGCLIIGGVGLAKSLTRF